MGGESFGGGGSLVPVASASLVSPDNRADPSTNTTGYVVRGKSCCVVWLWKWSTVGSSVC